jgi:pantoate--beta-alanine ligase
MGQKDFQQVAVVAYLIQSQKIPVRLVMCPTIREANGLAMSSRNVRLSPEMHDQASVIYKTLRYCADHIDDIPFDALQKSCLDKLTFNGFRPEYFDIVDGHTLHRADHNTEYVVACCAVWADDVRLIDNMILREGR